MCDDIMFSYKRSPGISSVFKYNKFDSLSQYNFGVYSIHPDQNFAL